MTDKSRLRIEVGVLAVVFGGGAGWGAFEAKFGAFQTQLDNFKQTQDSTAAKVDRIDRRFAEWYCANLPPEKRAGCR